MFVLAMKNENEKHLKYPVKGLKLREVNPLKELLQK